MSDATENEVLATHVARGLTPHPLAVDRVYSVVVPDGSDLQIVDLETHRDYPDRMHGTTRLHDVGSLLGFVDEHEWDATKVYASLAAFRIVAVFNDDVKADGEQRPGWGDHRAELDLVRTPEWSAWEESDGRMMNQADFAEFIEDRLLDIVEPEAADMLELAQTFHAVTGVNFRSSTILASGQRQLTYEESTTATAGHGGKLVIPKEFVLGIPPFENGEAYRLTARLRFRLSSGSLALGYRLTRPRDVLRAAFDDVVDNVATTVAASVFRGTPKTS
jgi:uncharacterized protein YfdQ (DUF2303 family)